MPKPAFHSIYSLIGHYNYIECTRSKMERLFNEGAIVKRDIEIAYAGLYLDAISYFENFIESLFFNLLLNKIVHPSGLVSPKIIFRSPVICRDVVFGERSYVDWFPYEKTINRARIFFKKALPFDLLEKAEKKFIQQSLYIRNAIAHNSKHALKMFNKNVIEGKILLPREKTPVGYLRSYYTISPPQTQYELIISELVQIARKLCI